MSRTTSVVVLLAALAVSCERPTFTFGEGCEINTDCASPLVCVIGYCRRQCAASRDCGAGLRCLIDPESTAGGGCQLDNERACVLTSECTSGLVCQNGTCTTACVEPRDCAMGATCMAGACFDMQTELCVYNSDCMPPMVCGSDQQCRIECFGDRDCPYPRHCVASLCELIDAGSASDAGTDDTGL